ncbi:MAG TPA: ATP-binding cassette domain-containing protein [Chitinophagales bacterium]|nr:ATP-binding cassette domain-containing protein [Chitinophagales bacterium]
MTSVENATINIKGLSKSFGNLHVLSNIDLILNKGEHIAILGKSGSGKSVLIKIIAGLLLPDTGTVLTLGQNIATITEKEKRNLRLKIGFSFQNSALYDSMTVRENIEFPLVRKDKHLTQLEINKQVDAVLDAVGVRVKAEKMPSELSGGQRKRIGIARTLILEPELMLYDEPTAGLDPITCIEINNLIIELQKRYNSSAIIITHDLTCAKTTANKVVVLLEGQFVRQGTFKEVFETDIQIVKQFYDYNFII